jgi:hypothetical protein
MPAARQAYLSAPTVSLGKKAQGGLSMDDFKDCKDCSKYVDNGQGECKCVATTTDNIPSRCRMKRLEWLVRHFLAGQANDQKIQGKASKMITRVEELMKKMEDDFNSGEEWKNGT